MVFHSAEPPFANITKEGVTLTTKFFVDFHIYPAANNSLVLARIGSLITELGRVTRSIYSEMLTSSEVYPAIVNDRIVGNLNDTTVSFRQVQSRIGNFSERSDQLDHGGSPLECFI